MAGEIIPVPGDVPATAIMSRPVQAVSAGTRLADAHALFLRTGHGSLPVTRDGLPAGLLGRADCERAVRHGLGDRPVEEAMSPEAPSVSPETPARDIIGLLGAPGPGRVLVVAGGDLVGIISRSDVLVRLLGRQTDRAGQPLDTELHPSGEILEAASLLEARWAEGELGLLRRISAEAAGKRLYLVGGAVRDLLLDRPSYDLDLMVEDDGQALARRLAGVLPGEVSVHEPFGTATLVLAGGRRVDVATSRAELYAHPGALPDVTPAGLLHDLARRDFTVNALAMRVDPEAWGRVVDPYGGLADLRAGKLRILHNLSIVEDPTRLVRGIRFERALGMRLEARTAELVRFSLGSGRLDGLGGERLKTELRKLLALPDLAAAAARLAEFDAWRLVHRDLAGAQPDLAALAELEAHLPDWPGLRPEDRAAAGYRGTLAIVLAPLGLARAREALGALHSPAEGLRAVLQAIEAGALLGDQLASWLTAKASARYERFRHLGPDALRHLAARSGDPAVRQALADHLAQREVRLAGVDGDWLKAQGLTPGPLLGRVLADTLNAVIDGDIAGSEAERRFALTRARELGLAFEGRSGS